MKNQARWLFTVAASACLCGFASTSLSEVQEEVAGQPEFEMLELFSSVRGPNIIVARDGTVLAFARGGRHVRRSTDGGETWSKLQEIGTDSHGSAVVDDATGDVLVVNGRGHLWRSGDSGATWTKEEIVLKPNAMGHGTPDNMRIATGASESGITLRFGEHKGRLIMPARIQPPKANNKQEYWAYNYNMAIYSDDGGATWQASDPVQSGTGEGTLAELSDGRIYYNSRSHMSVDHRRRIAWSRDGGHRWVDWQVSDDLFEVGGPHYFKYSPNPSYGCNAGLVRMPDEVTGGKDVLLFSAPDNPGAGDKRARVKMTVWASFDGAKTWPVKRVVYEGPSGYSSLAADKNGFVYLMFENGDNGPKERLSVAKFNLDWLFEGRDWRALLTE